MRGPRTTRRGALALAGGLAFAGCGRLPSGQDDPPRLDGAALRAAVEGSDPTVAETFPVDLPDEHLAGSVDRARDLLTDVPDPLGPEEVPNGAIRDRMRRWGENAEDAIRGAVEAETGRETLSEARRARERAMAVSAAWRATEGEVTREDVMGEADGLRERLSTLDERVEYVGDDPARAAVIHAAIEEFVARVEGRLGGQSSSRYGSEGVLGVGELAGDHEIARASTADAASLFDAFVDSLDAERDLAGVLEDAARSLTGAVHDAADERSLTREFDAADHVDRDVTGTPAERALEELGYGLASGRWDGESAAGNPARAVLDAVDGFASLAAFDAIESRVADGESFVVEDATDVTDRRLAAVEAIDAATSSPPAPALTAEAVPEASHRVAYADETLERVGDDVRANALHRTVAGYVIAAERARALPAAAERVAERLRA